MGTLRLLLALAVVVSHSAPIFGLTLTGGLPAVQTFYIISGFYMALILDEKYRGRGWVRTFYLNRFLRIFPIYWMALAVVAGVSCASWYARDRPLALHFWALWLPQMTPSAVVAMAISNVTLFTQDAVMFLGIRDGHLAFTSRFWAEPMQAWKLLLIPQAWSLGVELLFYAVAPFLLRQPTRMLAFVAAGSLSLRVCLYRLGLDSDPWTYRFFPTELFFFCAGALAFRLYRSRLEGRPLDWRIGAGVGVLVLACTILFQYIPVFAREKSAPWGYYAVVVSTLPLLFHATRRSRIDGLVGELSYPMYVSHLFVITVLWGVRGTSDDIWALQVVVVTLLTSVALNRLARPFERLRARRAASLRG